MKDRLSILVMSCDRFRPVWDSFYALLDRYWPDFNGRIYHYSETGKPGRQDVTAINSGLAGDAAHWSDGLLYALDRVETPYVLLILEDIFLDRPVKTDRVEDCLAFMEANPAVKCLRLVPIPPAPAEARKGIGPVPPGAPYRISTQIALWDRQYLHDIARSGESPWQFEHDGTARSVTLAGEVWAVTAAPPEHRVMTHVNGLIRGKLTRRARQFLEKEGITPDPSIPVNSRLEEWYWFGAPGPARKALDFINHNLYPILWRNKL